MLAKKLADTLFQRHRYANNAVAVYVNYKFVNLLIKIILVRKYCEVIRTVIFILESIIQCSSISSYHKCLKCRLMLSSATLMKKERNLLNKNVAVFV